MARDITKLHPRLQEAIAKIQKQFPELGVGECLRTVAEQNALYAQGRTTPGSIVTNARGSDYGSQHQWGITFDFFYNVKGKEYSDSSWFKKVGAYAKTIGLAWGGDWTSPVDLPHIYLPDWGDTTTKLKSQYGTPEKFMATWGSASGSIGNSTGSNTAASSTTTYTGNSIVDYLNSIGVDSSLTNRKKLAEQYGIKNYTGTAAQNTELLNKMRSGSTSASVTPSAAQGINKVVVVSINQTITRAGAGESYESMGTLDSGTYVRVDQEVNGWYHIKDSNRYCKKSDCPDTIPAYNVVVTATPSLRRRYGAGEQYKQIGSLKTNQIATIDAVKNNWGHVSQNKDWVCLDFTKRK